MPAPGTQCDADTDGGEDFLVSDHQRPLQRILEPLGDLGGFVLAAEALKQDGKLISPQPADRIARTETALQPICN